MDYTINFNKELNGIELLFSSKPAAIVLDTIKKSGFRWNGKKSLWYAKNTPERLEVAKTLGDAKITEEKTTGAKKAVFDKDIITEEYKKAWNSEKMVKYCVDKLAAVAILPDGGIISIDKQSIETSFCFGESGYDYEDAAKMAAHARKSFEYFKNENMKNFDEAIKDLEDAKKESPRYYLIIKDIHYIGQKTDCKLRGLEWVRDVNILDSLGGSAYLEELPGKYINVYNGRIATKEEINIILEAYRQARTAHEKKVDAYLKKYGLSKVNSWTYWRDA